MTINKKLRVELKNNSLKLKLCYYFTSKQLFLVISLKHLIFIELIRRTISWFESEQF